VDAKPLERGDSDVESPVLQPEKLTVDERYRPPWLWKVRVSTSAFGCIGRARSTHL